MATQKKKPVGDIEFYDQMQKDLSNLSDSDFEKKYGVEGSAQRKDNAQKYLNGLAAKNKSEQAANNKANKQQQAQEPLKSEPYQQGNGSLISPNELEEARNRIGFGGAQAPASLNLGGGGLLTNDAQFYQFPTRTLGQQAAQDTLLNAGLRSAASHNQNLPQLPNASQFSIPQLGQAPQINPQQFLANQPANIPNVNPNQYAAQAPANIPTFNPQQFNAQAPGQIPQVNPAQFGFQQPNAAQVDQIPIGEFNFNPIEQQARQQFSQNTLPGIAERFASLGSNRGSSGLNSALASAGSGLESQLAGLRAQYGLQATNQQLQQQGTLAQLGLGNLNAATQYGLGNQQAMLHGALGNQQAQLGQQGNLANFNIGNQRNLLQGTLGQQGNLLGQQGNLANFNVANQANLGRIALGNQGNLAQQQANLGNFGLGNQRNALAAAQGNQDISGRYGIANQNALLGQQGNNLNYLLGGQRNQLQQGQLNQQNTNQLLNAGLAGQFENVYQPAQGNALGALLGAGINAAGRIGGAALGAAL